MANGSIKLRSDDLSILRHVSGVNGMPPVSPGAIIHCAIALVVLASGGCHGNEMEPAEQLRVPASVIDVGFVPVDGASARIPLRNDGDTPIRIKNVRSSCGCVVAHVPEFISAESDASIRVKLSGEAHPARKTSTILLELVPSGGRVVRLNYATGRVPVFQPDVVSVAKAPELGYVGTACLWVYAKRDDSEVSIRLVQGQQSAVKLSLEPDANYERVGPLAARLRRRGLYMLRCRVRLTECGNEPLGAVAVEVTNDGHCHDVQLQVSREDPRIIEVRPGIATIAFRDPGELAGARRVFFLESTSAAECKVVRAPPFLTTSFARIDDVTWKLEVQVVSVEPTSVTDTVITVEAQDGDTTATVDARMAFKDLRRG